VRVTSPIEYQKRDFLQAEILCAPLGQIGSPPDAIFIVLHSSPRIEVVNALKASTQ
jgi:hypothetical protein